MKRAVVLKKIKIGFIGGGNMARAMIKGLKSAGARGLFVYDTDPKALRLAVKAGAKKLKSNSEVAAASDMVVIAVKPASVMEALTGAAGNFGKKRLIISIAAGVTINSIMKWSGSKAPVIRAMPNMPALAGMGACVFAAGRGVSRAQAAAAGALFTSFCGVCYEMKESDMNKITAISGSGPAYFFYMAEAVIEAAQKMGLSRHHALMLTAQTMAGAGRMLLDSGAPPEELRMRVTSRGGTTKSAVSVLDGAGVKKTIVKAVLAAKKRGDEMGRGRQDG